MSKAPAGGYGSARRILVVDDDGSLRSLIGLHLVERGFNVTEAPSAEEALVEARRQGSPFDLVLVDVHLPGVPGIRLASLLHAWAPLRPVIVITGDQDEKLAHDALKQGAAGCLLKPFKLFELDAAVGQALARLELLEAAEVVARESAGKLPDRGRAGGGIPLAWTELADDRSGGGPGHGYRVSLIAGGDRFRAAAVSGDGRRSREPGAGGAGARAGSAARPEQGRAELGVAAEVICVVRTWRRSGAAAAFRRASPATRRQGVGSPR